MANLKDLRNRIASVKSTQKITAAMKMVAAAKLRRAQDTAVMARPYAERMDRVLGNVVQGIGGSGTAPAMVTGTGSDQVQLIIVVTADRGLCGGFNSNIVRRSRQRIRELEAAGKEVPTATAPAHEVTQIGTCAQASFWTAREGSGSLLLCPDS